MPYSPGRSSHSETTLYISVSGEVSALVVEVARLRKCDPRTRNFDHKGTYFTRDKDISLEVLYTKYNHIPATYAIHVVLDVKFLTFKKSF